MGNYFRMLAGVMFLALFFSACRTPKTNLNYFSADKRDSSHTRIWQSYQPKIQPGDRLSIVVSALNAESAKLYNLTGSGSGSSAGGGILVDEQGRLLYPQLGFIKAAGLEKGELRDTLLHRLRKYLTDPVVTVDFSNFKVTVLGEVSRQGPISVADGKLTLLEALGQAGDVTLTGKRDSILVIREYGGQRDFGYVNLLTNESFKSPYFVLQQNDVVYVPMIDKKAIPEEKTDFVQKVLPVVTLLSSLSSLIWLLYNLRR